MKSKIIQVDLNDGNIQKYQLIDDFKWKDLIFKSPSFDNRVIRAMAHLYEINIIPKSPSSYGLLIFFNIGNIKINLDRNTDIGYIYNDGVLLNYYFNKAKEENTITQKDNKIFFENKQLQSIFDNLVEEQRLSFAKGSLDTITFFPLSNDMGYLSDIESSQVKVNSHFFLMDETDLDSPYDEMGTPHGLALKNSKILSPPLNHRECLLVDYDNKVKINNLEVSDLTINIEQYEFENGVNSHFFYRPETRITPKCKGSSIVIIKNQIVAVKEKGQVVVPMAGFVIQTEASISIKDLKVSYLGESNNYKLGIQVGPAMVVEGTQVKELTCPFYKGEGTPYPSTVYPLDFDKGRAARIGLGTFKTKPILIWAEGAGKLGYIKNEESCGASLLEFSTFCKEYGIENLVNLDGGGSAQIIYKNKRILKIADRKNDKITEAERPIPLGLVIL